ncbi:hypothetical protein HGRIS_014528 [Hohenbuehelia grisea]|uniref:Uncharacterized protein n=1 Tax=Hohenbuehelia grisea TaxID=104357 RepID=A0ABR3JUQ4_9AGAR
MIPHLNPVACAQAPPSSLGRLSRSTPGVARCRRSIRRSHTKRMPSVSSVVLLSIAVFLAASCNAAPVAAPASVDAAIRSVPLPIPTGAVTPLTALDKGKGPAFVIMAEEEGGDGSDPAENGDLVPPPFANTRASLLRILFVVGAAISALSALLILRPSTLPPGARKLLFSPLLTAAAVSGSVSSGVRRTGERLHRATTAIHRKATPGRKGEQEFRVGEERLVGWAQEELGLEEAGADDVDVMVNAAPLAPPGNFATGDSLSVADEDDWDRYADGRGEYIPLKPSPAYGNGSVGAAGKNAAGNGKGKGYWFRYGYGTIG